MLLYCVSAFYPNFCVASFEFFSLCSCNHSISNSKYGGDNYIHRLKRD